MVFYGESCNKKSTPKSTSLFGIPFGDPFRGSRIVTSFAPPFRDFIRHPFPGPYSSTFFGNSLATPFRDLIRHPFSGLHAPPFFGTSFTTPFGVLNGLTKKTNSNKKTNTKSTYMVYWSPLAKSDPLWSFQSLDFEWAMGSQKAPSGHWCFLMEGNRRSFCAGRRMHNHRSRHACGFPKFPGGGAAM